jgi:hypothetical protein
LKLFDKIIGEAVSREIDRRLSDVKQIQPKEGYNSTEAVRGALFHWVLVPFNDVPVWCKLRCLNQTQLESCGGVSLVNFVKGVSEKVPTTKEMIDIRNTQEAMAKMCLVIPSFDEIMKLITDEDLVIQGIKKQITELKDVDPKTLPPTKRKDLEEELFKLEISVAFLLPEDAIGFLTSWALGIDVSNIKDITEDQLFSAALLAEKGHDNPTDHINGYFVDRDKPDLDTCAWNVLHKRREQESNKKGGMKWIGRGE